MYVFISHSSKEANIAGELCKAIESNGNNCFIAPRDIRSGYEYAEEIANGIDNSDAVLLLLSKAANNSPHVLREVERAVTKSIPILVYKVEEVELTKSMEYFLMTHQWMEAGRDSYADVARCINNLNDISSKAVVVNNNKDIEGNKGSGKLKPVIIMTAAIAVIALAVVIGVVAMSKKGPGDGSTTATTTGDAVSTLRLGDTITMGTYNGEEMYWRVLKISEDGTEAVVVARDVISVKAYDAPDSGRYNHDGTKSYLSSDSEVYEDIELQAYIRGNSSWENSNIRTWLNSALENVKYEGQAPVSSAMADRTNGYSGEKGFLCSFTDEELAAIKTTNVETKGNALSDKDTIVTQDKVFLLSVEELDWFEEANVSLLAIPTAGAIEKNETYWYQNYCIDFGVENIMWWLREPVEGSASECYLIGNGYYEDNIYTWEVGVESFGIRPAMTVDLSLVR